MTGTWALNTVALVHKFDSVTLDSELALPSPLQGFRSAAQLKPPFLLQDRSVGDDTHPRGWLEDSLQ